MMEEGTGAMEKEVTICNPLGIHARPANMLIATAGQYPCEILLQSGGKQAKAKSIVGILKLALKMGDKVTVVTNGEKEAEALAAVAEFLESTFD
jgi:phosphotransferase system HPr (HPr) family protein